MPTQQIITGQAVSPKKSVCARELRHEMTPAEKKLWASLRTNRLEGLHFRRQQVIEPYIVDFYCHQAALVVEVDGGVHQHQQDYDQKREEDLRAHGLRVVRFTNREVNENIKGVLEEILRLCK